LYRYPPVPQRSPQHIAFRHSTAGGRRGLLHSDCVAEVAIPSLGVPISDSVLAKIARMGESFTQSRRVLREGVDSTLQVKSSRKILSIALSVWIASSILALATPANKAAMERYYEHFQAKSLKQCTTCHLPSEVKEPADLDEFPHNPFGDRLRKLGEALEHEGKAKDLATRLVLVAKEDSDGDGIANEDEVLLGSNPGDAKDVPAAEAVAQLPAKRAEFQKFLASYRWRPFERVQRPALPKVKNEDWVRTPIDAFIAAEHEQRGLQPRPGASKSILLRRVYLDLIGLSPTPEEQQAYENDHSSDAYEKVVDRLLNDPRYGERWGRHWMDVWRYSDWAGWTDGKQVRDSQRHIWRWRDWIVESLNEDKGYDQMVVQMLAADEIAPEDTNAGMWFEV